MLGEPAQLHGVHQLGSLGTPSVMTLLQSPCASRTPPAGGPGMTPSCPLCPPERGERCLCPAQPLLPLVRRDAPVLAPAPRGPPQERRRHGDRGAGGLLQPPEQESPGGQWGHILAVSPGWGWHWEALAAEVMPGRRWTPALAGGWDTRVSSAEGESGVWGESGAEPLLFHAMGHDVARVTCQLPAQQFRPGRFRKDNTGSEGH